VRELFVQQDWHIILCERVVCAAGLAHYLCERVVCAAGLAHYRAAK